LLGVEISKCLILLFFEKRLLASSAGVHVPAELAVVESISLFMLFALCVGPLRGSVFPFKFGALVSFKSSSPSIAAWIL
jgi:hypothetical protein